MIKIRRATGEDALILSRLSMDVQDLHAGILPTLFKPITDENYALEFMQKLLDDPNVTTFIAVTEGEPVGYILTKIRQRPENPFRYVHKTLSVEHISVRPAWRRHRVGQQLMASVKQLAIDEKVGRISLDVWAFNERAQAFFASEGFETLNLLMSITV